jgi:hypothetical protein
MQDLPVKLTIERWTLDKNGQETHESHTLTDPFWVRYVHDLEVDAPRKYFLPARLCRHPKHCRSHKALRRVLKANPWIATSAPRPNGGGRNALLVHVGDWARWLRSRGVRDPLDLPAGEVDAGLALAAVRAARRRQAAVRRKKSAGR